MEVSLTGSSTCIGVAFTLTINVSLGSPVGKDGDHMKYHSNSGKHLTLDERRIILKGIEAGSDKASIARTIGKDKSTVSKEIRKHRICVRKFDLALECAAYQKCKHGRACWSNCPDYTPFRCSRRDRSPGACNGCSSFIHCRFSKFKYDPEKAEHEYRITLHDSREGVNLTSSEAKKIGDIVKPLLDKGISPYVIIREHPELGICEKTLYNYIESGILQPSSGTIALDLRRQVGRKIPRAKKTPLRKREDRKYLQGRAYKDYLAYLEENPNAFVTQMDTIYNDETNGPFIQTFRLMSCKLLFAVLHKNKTADNMLKGVNILESVLGRELFEKHCHVILTDRGSEFSLADAIESRTDGTRRTRIYYCDPMRSNQKGSLENNHELLRYILPKGTDLKALGLTSQKSLKLALSHVNSYPVEMLGGKSPLQYTEFLFPKLYEALNKYGIKSLNVNDVVLKPYLLKNNVK